MSAAAAPTMAASSIAAAYPWDLTQFAARRSGGMRQPPTHSSSQCFAFQASQRLPMRALCAAVTAGAA